MLLDFALTLTLSHRERGILIIFLSPPGRG
jgi:hypothetical protein